MNKIILLGRLTRDPEIRYTQTGACVAQFTLAVDRPVKNQDGSREADFIPCVAWGKIGEVVGNYVHKGQRLLVEGRLQIRSYDAKDGSKRWVTEVIVNHGEFVERKEQQPAAPQSGGYNTGGTTGAAQQGGSYYDGGTQPAPQGMESFGSAVPFDEEIPF